MFPTGKKDCSEDENIDDYHPDLNDGYSQSKWVAEQLITRAGQKGLPVVIYRLGTIYFKPKFLMKKIRNKPNICFFKRINYFFPQLTVILHFQSLNDTTRFFVLFAQSNYNKLL